MFCSRVVRDSRLKKICGDLDTSYDSSFVGDIFVALAYDILYDISSCCEIRTYYLGYMDGRNVE